MEQILWYIVSLMMLVGVGIMLFMIIKDAKVLVKEAELEADDEADYEDCKDDDEENEEYHFGKPYEENVEMETDKKTPPTSAEGTENKINTKYIITENDGNVKGEYLPVEIDVSSIYDADEEDVYRDEAIPKPQKAGEINE